MRLSLYTLELDTWDQSSERAQSQLIAGALYMQEGVGLSLSREVPAAAEVRRLGGQLAWSVPAPTAAMLEDLMLDPNCVQMQLKADTIGAGARLRPVRLRGVLHQEVGQCDS